MNELSDQELLRDFAERQSEQAFAELVRRHIDLVYSAALRMVVDPHTAKDVTQNTFIAFAKNARQVRDRSVVSGWLHSTARNFAANAVRTEVRRREREQEAAAMNELLANEPAAAWKNIAPHLDDAIAELGDSDRDALLLRYFEHKSAREMAQIFGTSEEAAQKRVSRAVERLREFFSKRGVAIGTGALVVIISANAVHAAPLALVATISTAAAIAGTTLHAATAITTTKAIAMTLFQKTLVATTVTVLVGVSVYETHQATRLRKQVQIFQQQQAPLAAQLQHLQQERDDATSQLASLTNELENLKSSNLELLKLRNELDLMTQIRAAAPNVGNTIAAATDTTPNNRPPPVDGRELGTAVVRGEAGAFDKLLAEANAEYQNFNTNDVGLNDTTRSELGARTFAPIQAAFKMIEEAAVAGNASALEALTRSLQIQELQGIAVHSLGQLAANSDAGALEILLHPNKYGMPLSGTISPLKPAADNGNQNAIDALAAIAKDQKAQPLWYMTADSLAKAAASGNPVAIDALVNMSSSTNRTIQSAVAEALRGVPANQNAKAAEALRAMDQSKNPPADP